MLPGQGQGKKKAPATKIFPREGKCVALQK
jgi:hypothetical protein